MLEDDTTVAFLDHRPLLPGHVLVVPRTHYETLGDLPPDEVGPLFVNVQRLALAVEHGLNADGSFVAVNIRISQSVPHLHVHVVPRRKNDGLFGKTFQWMRRPYPSDGGYRRGAARDTGGARFGALSAPSPSACSNSAWATPVDSPQWAVSFADLRLARHGLPTVRQADRFAHTQVAGHHPRAPERPRQHPLG